MSDSITTATQSALWLDTLSPQPVARAQLDGDRNIDVAIVGGGFSGLWTAYYLRKLDPTVRIIVLEANHCGYGASGRNGGWAVGEVAGSFKAYAKRSTPSESMRLSRAIFDAVDEIGSVAKAESIECGYAKGGWIRVARNSPQARRQVEDIDHHRELGFAEDEIRLLGREEAKAHLNATDVQSGIFFSPTAALNPAQLVTGLAATVERMGVEIVEDTAVRAITDTSIHTDHGVVYADFVIRATEAYTRDLAGLKRELLPVYSLMIATEPLPDSIFDQIGLGQRQTFADDRHMVIYGQRTADNRLAFGGRGVPYLFGSAIAQRAELHEPSHRLLQETLVDMLPAVADAQITHRWGGVLAIPRNWVPGLRFNPESGQGVLGGYIGEGVAAANLAGRSMADLIAGHETDRTSLPWVGVASRKWEPEPFRWLGVRSSRRILAAADEREYETDEEAKLAFRISRLLRGA